MKRCIRCWRPRRNARSSRWCPSSTTATGVGSGPMGGILWTMWTHAVRSYPILDFSQWTFPKGHDMCYGTIDKSGFCDGLHPALVTYQFQPLDDGTLACTDCSGEDLLNKQRSDEEVACHCKVIGQNARNDQKSSISLIFSDVLLWRRACCLHCRQWALSSSSPSDYPTLTI